MGHFAQEGFTILLKEQLNIVEAIRIHSREVLK
jgi:hypothetical protein